MVYNQCMTLILKICDRDHDHDRDLDLGHFWDRDYDLDRDHNRDPDQFWDWDPIAISIAIWKKITIVALRSLIAELQTSMRVFPKTFHLTWAFSYRKFVQYIHMLWPGRFILVESVSNERFEVTQRSWWPKICLLWPLLID